MKLLSQQIRDWTKLLADILLLKIMRGPTRRPFCDLSKTRALASTKSPLGLFLEPGSSRHRSETHAPRAPSSLPSEYLPLPASPPPSPSPAPASPSGNVACGADDLPHDEASFCMPAPPSPHSPGYRLPSSQPADGECGGSLPDALSPPTLKRNSAQSAPSTSSTSRKRARNEDDCETAPRAKRRLKRRSTLEDSATEESSEDTPYEDDDDCRTHEVKERSQGPGKPPLKDYYNRKGTKLEIVKTNVKVDVKEFLKHAEQIPHDKTQWRCTYRDDDEPCGYQSKRHLVKRHVEGKHLGINVAGAKNDLHSALMLKAIISIYSAYAPSTLVPRRALT
ncbi:unnamed protein product [Peniophora sp. CBMAI 1063]|nr:unnamed protein product [Peniophora sp. CBMAI 1063]